MTTTVFIIDDDAIQLKQTEQLLREKCHYRTITAQGGREAIEYLMLRQHPQPDIILLDLIMPEVSGIEVVRTVRRIDPNIPILLLSVRENHTLLPEAMRLGANDYLFKPTNLAMLTRSLNKLMQLELMRQEIDRLNRLQAQQAALRLRMDHVLGDSDVMQTVRTQAQRAAQHRRPVCFTGEKGCGKEWLARATHGESEQGAAHLVALSMQSDSSIWRALLDPVSTPSNVFETTDPVGAVFIRDLDRLPFDLQEALAERITTAQKDASNPWHQMRWMASVSQPLRLSFQQEQLAESLYYVFASDEISLPPLRDRGEDVLMLARHYLRQSSARHSHMIQELSSQAQKQLLAYRWPGNVTELVNQMQRAAYLCRTHVLEQMEPYVTDPSANTLPRTSRQAALPDHAHRYSLLNPRGDVKSFEELEAEAIRFAIDHYGGKMTEVARRLGIGRSTLYRKIQDYNLRTD